jgi:hypothetical protein
MVTFTQPATLPSRKVHGINKIGGWGVSRAAVNTQNTALARKQSPFLHFYSPQHSWWFKLSDMLMLCQLEIVTDISKKHSMHTTHHTEWYIDDIWSIPVHAPEVKPVVCYWQYTPGRATVRTQICDFSRHALNLLSWKEGWVIWPRWRARFRHICLQ